ncbi:hypothetical protein E2C01_007372 [Portunus trituberculatus]|uniref:Uncharacterized protein n=1 Tax=Portunus trituberculatus TaxID=210409 RepID=A0A5B7D0Z9_PORTR|nr:hypothetical protein [Portunus trituberculatus]
MKEKLFTDGAAEDVGHHAAGPQVLRSQDGRPLVLHTRQTVPEGASPVPYPRLLSSDAHYVTLEEVRVVHRLGCQWDGGRGHHRRHRRCHKYKTKPEERDYPCWNRENKRLRCLVHEALACLVQASKVVDHLDVGVQDDGQGSLHSFQIIEVFLRHGLAGSQAVLEDLAGRGVKLQSLHEVNEKLIVDDSHKGLIESWLQPLGSFQALE